MNTNALARFIKAQYPAAISIHDGFKKQPEFIEAFAVETRKFLEQHRSQYISCGDILNYYHGLFPKLRLKVKDITKDVDSKLNPFNFKDDMVTLASAENIYSKKKKCLRSFGLELSSLRPLDHFKRLFGAKDPNKGKFYVNSDFVDTFIHEGIHIMQNCIKPVSAVQMNAILKYCNGDRRKANILINLADKIYLNSIYQQSTLPIGKKGFGQDVKKRLEKTFFPKKKTNINARKSNGMSVHATPKVVAAQIKTILRSVQQEKQAYEVGEKQSLIFSHPKLAKSKLMLKLFEKYAQLVVSANFKFGSKIEALKKAYFEAISEVKLQIARR